VRNGHSRGTLLVVDDEETVRSVVSRYLREAGFSTQTATSGPEALGLVQRQSFDLVVLDIMLPGMDGLQVLRCLRQNGNLPVVLLSAKRLPAERVAGLRLGADDYIPKPFAPGELVARVEAVLRRATRREEGEAPLVAGALVIDPAARLVTLHGREVPLAKLEYDLLSFFARHPRRVFSGEELLDEVWARPLDVATTTVAVHVHRLRMKVENNPAKPRRLLTVRGVGYRFQP